jgi:16S rRNA (cytosine1402-N4)-methyltransferase
MEYHIPVLADAVLEGLSPQAGETFLDATLGGAGHALLIAERLGPAGTLIGMDQDNEAIEAARLRFAQSREGLLPHILLLHARFDRIGPMLDAAGYPKIDRALFDLGVSSHQLDDPLRGFTFQNSEAPLDMRMDPDSVAPTAADLLNTLPERELANLFWKNADERWSARIAEFVCRRRQTEPFRTAGQLVETVKAAVPKAAWPKGIHPGTRVFQALRIAVNQELEILSDALGQAVNHLRSGGRIAVISYHSGEDRMVKKFFLSGSGKCQCKPTQLVCDCGAAQPNLLVLTKKPITASPEEIAKNPRSRSAKLRIAQKR